jgi:hypothetical protein
MQVGAIEMPNEELPGAFLDPRTWATSKAGPSIFFGAPSFPPIIPSAIGSEAPVRNAPLSFSNPFNFSLTDLQRIYLWTKLMFDPRLLQSNPFFMADPNPGPDLFNEAPLNPPNGSPVLPTDFR